MPKGTKRPAAEEAAGLFEQASLETVAPSEGVAPIDALAIQATSILPVRAGARRVGAARQAPFSKQFSASQIPSLGGFLDVVAAASGDVDRIQAAVLANLRPGADVTLKPFQTMAYNALVSATYYGLVNPDRTGLTPFGEALRDLSDEAQRRDSLVSHLLRNLNGAELVLGIEELKRAGRHLKKEDLAAYFAAHGLYSNPDGTDINAVTSWLRGAGLFETDIWSTLDEGRFAALAGMSLKTIAEISGVDQVGFAILEELAFAPGYSSTTGEMRRLLAAKGAVKVNVAGFVKAHLVPLEKRGFITIEKTTAGRGGSSAKFTGTAEFENEVVRGVLERVRGTGITVSGPELQVPLATLITQLRDPDRNIRGKALELFALRLLQHVGLRLTGWRNRSKNAEEIDGSAEGEAQVHTRWQVQCKNTDLLEVDDAAKEVGIAVRNRSTVILLVTTGKITRAANDFVDDVIRYSPYTILRVERADIARLARDESRILDVLGREAKRAREIRSRQPGQ